MTDIVKNQNNVDVDVNQIEHCPAPDVLRSRMEYKWLSKSGYDKAKIEDFVERNLVDGCVAQLVLADCKKAKKE